MLTPQSPKEYLDNQISWAEKAFKDHSIVKEISPRHWYCRDPEKSSYWFEVVILQGGGIVVWGDIDLVCFAYSSGGEPIEQLAWIANSYLDYATEKATIGGTCLVYNFNPNVALYELEDAYIKEEFTKLKPLIEAFKRESLSLNETSERLYNWGYGDYFENLGKVTQNRVIFAHQAVKKLYSLLVD